jgi:translocator protein
MKSLHLYKLLTSLAICLFVVSLSGYITRMEVSGWYLSLQKPSFNPPSWFFGPAWSVLFVLMSFSLFLVRKAEIDSLEKRNTIIVFSLQLALVFLWTIVFFKLHSIGWTIGIVLLLWLFILIFMFKSYSINKWAALLQVPYLLWISFTAFYFITLYFVN